MSESKFTPGPWSVGLTRRSSYGPLSVPEVPVHVGAYGNAGGPGNALAIVYLGGTGAISADEDAVKANAHLIAAAPELYAALKQIVHWCDHNDWGTVPKKIEHAMVGALAKAEGR